MSKRIHPIRKLARAVIAEHYGPSGSRARSERVVARHVAPLLAALDVEHAWGRGHYVQEGCLVCRLLAAWRGEIR